MTITEKYTFQSTDAHETHFPTLALLRVSYAQAWASSETDPARVSDYPSDARDMVTEMQEEEKMRETSRVGR
jgi:hypothetical protein